MEQVQRAQRRILSSFVFQDAVEKETPHVPPQKKKKSSSSASNAVRIEREVRSVGKYAAGLGERHILSQSIARIVREAPPSRCFSGTSSSHVHVRGADSVPPPGQMAFKHIHFYSLMSALCIAMCAHILFFFFFQGCTCTVAAALNF